jgi:hypothetical protein
MFRSQCLALSLLFSLQTVASQTVDNFRNASQADLFSPCPQISVLGPSQFPKPTDYSQRTDLVPVIQPILGKHTSSNDALFAYAEGYTVGYYLLFLETLSQTGYTGDVVLAIAEERIVDQEAFEYLRDYAARPTGPRLIVYQTDLTCADKGSGPGKRHLLSRSGDTDGEYITDQLYIYICYCEDVYIESLVYWATCLYMHWYL